MEWVKKNVDTVIVLGGIISCFLCINLSVSQFEKRFSSLEKDIAIIKTVLIMENKYPKELAKSEEK